MSSRSARCGALVALVSLTACPGTIDDPAAFELEAGADGGTNCADVPVAVFEPRCGSSGCHGASTPAAQLDLVSPDLYSRLVGKNASTGPGVLIDPGHSPEKSVLYLKLTSMPPFGSQMPFTGAKLDATALACVSNWITSGGSIDGGTTRQPSRRGL
jgi:hypothetical protein